MFTGKSALVTGAASGVGRATALMLAARGAEVCLLDRAGEEAERVAAELDGAIAISCDLASLEEIEAAAVRVCAWRPELDVLVHAAGVGQRGHSDEVTPAEWQRVVDVNLRAPFFLTQALLPQLSAVGGAVVAVASIAGLAGWPYSAVYSASKGGLVTMIRSLAIELGPRGVRLNAVCPGGVDTPMLDDFAPLPGEDASLAKRGPVLDADLSQPEEIATVICFLASPEATRITGTTLTIDAGTTA